MKKVIGVIALIILLIVAITAWLIFAPATKFDSISRYVYVRNSPSAQKQIMYQLDTGNIIRSAAVFNFFAKQAKAWNMITPGRFEIKKGESIFYFIRTLSNNHQSAGKVNY